MTDAVASIGYDTCQSVDCPERWQQLVEIELASGDTEILAFCAIHTFVVVSRDAGGNVEVVGP